MGLRKTGKIVMFGMGLLFASSVCFSHTVIDDFDDGNNKSKILKYWYFYADKDNSGTSTIYGDPKPDFVGEYDGKDGTYGAVMDFSLGDTTGMTDGCKPYVAMGLNFAEGTSQSARYAYDLTGADSISFWVKGDKAFTARLYMELTTVKNWDDFFYSISVTTSWQHVTIAMKKDNKKGFKQNGWDDEFADFDLTKIAKMNFRVRWDENPDLTDGVLYIDSIVMHGNAKFPKPGTINPEEVGSFPSKGLLNNFENGKKNNLGYSWYSYLDGGSSEFTSGYDIDTKQILLDETGGYDNTQGISVSIKLGDMIDNKDDPKNPIAPYCGLGTNLGNEKDGFFDASSATGVYLNYKSDIDVELELLDDAERSDGIAFHIVLPSTQGEWKEVSAKFSAFVLPDWVNLADLSDVEATLNKSALANLQFKLTGDAGIDGNFAIDNIYIDGANIVGVLHRNQTAKSNNFSIIQNHNVVKVDFNKMTTNAKVSLINPMGKIIQKQNINPISHSCSLPLSDVTNGLYILRISSANGLVESVPLHLMR